MKIPHRSSIKMSMLAVFACLGFVYSPTGIKPEYPSISYLTYIGGGNHDSGRGIAVDKDGNFIVAGFTNSVMQETAVRNNRAEPIHDIFLLKFSPGNASPIFLNYYGGSNKDEAKVMATGPDGAIYLSSRSNSYDFPVSKNAFGKEQASTYDIIVIKVDEKGEQVLYSNIFGGSSMEEARGMAIDKWGNCIVVGGTHSLDFPVTKNAHKLHYSSNPEPDPGLVVYTSGSFVGEDAFITKINPEGTSMVFSTFFGGMGYEKAWAADTDNDGNVFVTGYTTSEDLPVSRSAYQSRIRGTRDAFIAKFSPEGQLLAMTYLGGREDDRGMGIAVADDGSVWVAGNTSSFDFPSKSAVQDSKRGGYDLFLTRMDNDLSEVIFSTYWGGEKNDMLTSEGLSLDSGSNPILSGSTESNDFPLVFPVKNTLTGNTDGFCVKMDVTKGVMTFSSYIGGSDHDEVEMAVAGENKIYLIGNTRSQDLPVSPDALRKSYSGNGDAFVMIISGI
jgi:hypothetical protein